MEREREGGRGGRGRERERESEQQSTIKAAAHVYKTLNATQITNRR